MQSFALWQPVFVKTRHFLELPDLKLQCLMQAPILSRGNPPFSTRYKAVLDKYIGRCMLPTININMASKNLPMGVRIVIPVVLKYWHLVGMLR